MKASFPVSTKAKFERLSKFLEDKPFIFGNEVNLIKTLAINYQLFLF